MNISELSIRRPVLSTVLTIIILLFGLIGYTYLGVREYPSVDNPIISVSCSYTGANADVIENQITEPLEQNINGIPGIRSLTSVSQQGQSRITVEFELSVDLETAANDVRDKVSRAQRYLPRDCDPPTVSKADADAVPILMVALQSNKRSLLELSEIADLTVKEQLQTISDVSSVSIWGEKKYSMRLWLDPTKMSGYGITPVDVKNAIDQENIELPSGSIEGNTTELTIRTLGLMHTPEEFNNLIIKEDANRIIRFSDIGRAELGAADIKSYMKMNGVPMVGVVVVPQPGANHIQIADAVYERMERMKKDLPEDVTYSYGFDNTKFIRASISEVESTVYEAFVLVIIIIFLFLRDWRVTLVPCIVIPVSLIGAFFVMYVAGFSINVLTMLAVVLSVGLVVDDAIVMTENIYVRIEKGMPPKEAGIEAKGYVCDVTNEDVVNATVEDIIKEFGKIDILVNNAGIRQDNLMIFMQDEQWHSVMDTTMNGFFYITRRLLKDMLTHRNGRIINMASLSGIKGLPGQVNYSAAKAALIGATKALAQEVAQRKVTVNAVAPGFITSDMTKDLNEAELKKLVPMGRFGKPEEVAALVAFLASDEAAYITGEVISINGGLYT